MAGDFRVITIEDSGELQLIQFAKEGTSKRKYYDAKMKSDPFALFSSATDMIEYMLSKPKVLMWTHNSIASGDKRLRLLNIMDSVPTPGAHAYPKGSELRPMLDFHLLKMKESGVVDRIAMRYMPEPPRDIGVPDAQQLGYDNLIFPALILSFGTCGALAVVLVERLVRRAAPGGRPRPKNRWADAANAPDIIGPEAEAADLRVSRNGASEENGGGTLHAGIFRAILGQ